ncbi:hypothetical protein [Rheinheimera sp. MMS21-TC3]|uniref:hypothetical protein n=1 Tax=Rheinheimera sp. MMS21-TC3 TaxID=3072790 RepID=UPI0028C469A6|nr:hypothetical protein [Rheinheimera sp. MMS21-TC3]WNO60445.1 hypothetical protein RDV63_05625 [Rheinheimera sp. MMS21-TC3]
MPFSPWQFTAPYISYTPILAPEMNGNLGGISVSLKYVADELNNFIPRLPPNFTGSNKLPVSSYHNTLIGISGEGDLELIDKAAFGLLSGRDLTIVKTLDAALNIDGNSHANFYYCQHEDADPEVVTAVTVNEATATVEGTPTFSSGTVVFFTQVSDTPLVFVEAPGVTVITPGLLKAFGKGSTVALVSIDLNTWVMVGDVYPATVVVP